MSAPGKSLSSPRALGYRFPAEWEPQRAVWLAWPHHESDYPGKLEAVRWAYCDLIGWLCRAGQVGLIVASPEQERDARQRLARIGVDRSRVELLSVPTDRAWTRDYLPSWLVKPAGATPAALGAVKWHFNGWARYDDHELDEAAGGRIADHRADCIWLPGTESGPHRRFVLEGGAIDTDGEGTLLTTEDCLLGTAFPRNPGLGREAVEAVLSEFLCVDRVIWLPGDVAGDDTSGHVDDVARFVAPGKVVVAVEPNPADHNHEPLRRARERLAASTDARGRRLEVIELPMPAPRFDEGSRLPATYANFLLFNELVLVPTFNDPADRAALGILAELFPSRRVVGIHCGDLVLGLGTVHCSTNQEPAL